MLAPSIRVIERGWLNSNQIVLRSPGDNVLVDSGYCTHAPRTLELVREALEGEGLARLINTHCHSDHMGGNRAIAAAYGCRVTVPEGEVKHIRPWTPQSVWMEQFDQRAEPFEFHDTLAAGDRFRGGGFTWEAHAAPGHDMDALMFFEPSNRVLISGDALWENGMGFVWPMEGPNPYIEAAREALGAIDRLDPAVVIPGHGRPFADARRVVAEVRGKLDRFARDPIKNARHAVKVMFVFALLDRGSMPVADVEAYVSRVPFYRQMGAQFLGMEGSALGRWLVAELERTGAVRIHDAILRPAMPA